MATAIGIFCASVLWKQHVHAGVFNRRVSVSLEMLYNTLEIKKKIGMMLY
jgi:hypothetical protein